ncbi:hypothetical protein D9M72_361100 [compost metagenome]
MRELFATLGAGQRVLLHRVVLARGVQRWRIGEELVVVGGCIGNGLRAALRHYQHVGGRIGGIAAVLGAQLFAQRGLRRRVKLRIGPAVGVLRGQLQPRGQFAVQPVSGPIRRLVGAVAPDGAQLHAAHGLPGGLAVEDLFTGEERAALGRDDLGRHWRGLPVHLDAVVAEQGECDRQHGDQQEPESAVGTHDAKSLVMVAGGLRRASSNRIRWLARRRVPW